jgi:hypothetical protein
MNDAQFDQVTKVFGTVGSRRLVLGGLLGGVLGLGRLGVAGASHKHRHHCTPSHRHPCPAGQACRQVSGEWMCESTCQALEEVCVTDNDCCEDLRCCPSGRCESALDNCDGLD